MDIVLTYFLPPIFAVEQDNLFTADPSMKQLHDQQYK